MKKNKINPIDLFDGSAFGMSQAVIDAESELIFISGQVDWNKQYQTRTKDIAGQMDGAIRNLNIALRESGSSVDHLLSIRILVRGEFGDHFKTIANKISRYLGDSRPAITCIGVASLASPETLVEIEAIARKSCITND